ncbi:NAD(P)/FAD-dependent oxidoreductase [Dinghuibacter silviterrae]|uniref:Glycine/D-amino acid oxidase-like deaminating enzyme n=1 Tax=Dinghuibacter silviterrae TaxID=1539049 RepID=A0A4R8DFV1_9BACT|nr:FAD-dependent oxidoreductase [Dinghuibacter silviterrae]TDW96489.1 glycine/D-amino acid oxidase-like deaminating enzyme [Dinghuibacter silviterrae]
MAMENATFSIWEKESYLGPRDVVIVGGGLVGLWSAWFLKQAHPALTVTLLERGLLPSGASTRNAGFACFGSPSEILADMALSGRDAALALVDMRFRGLEMMRRLLPDAVTGFEACGGYECFTSASVLDRLDALNADLREITGVYPVFSPADERLASLGLTGFDHLIANPLEGALHSGQLVRALTARVQDLGVTCLTGVTVQGWDEGPTGVRVRTDRSFSLEAGRLLLCTNGFTKELLSVDVTPARGQVLVTAPIPGLKLRGTFHFDEGFYYFRHLGDRVLLGGARNRAFAEETTAVLETSPTIQGALEAFLRDHVPQAAGVPINHRWAGIMGMGAEKRPLLKAVSDKVFCAVRLSGVGVAISPLVGSQAADLVLGKA